MYTREQLRKIAIRDAAVACGVSEEYLERHLETCEGCRKALEAEVDTLSLFQILESVGVQNGFVSLN